MNRSVSRVVLGLLVVAGFVSRGVADVRSDVAALQALVNQLQAELQLVRAEVRQLRNEVRTLRGEGGPDVLARPADELERTMYLESTTIERGVDDRTVEIQALRDEAAELTANADTLREDAARLEAYPWWNDWQYTTAPPWWNVERTRRRQVETAARRARTRLINEAIRLERRAQTLTGKALGMERDAESSVRMVMRGWDGQKTIVLHADRDLSHQVDGTTSGIFISWRGKPTAADEDSETWSVRSIDEVARPEDFVERDD